MPSKSYDADDIERRWQSFWSENETYRGNNDARFGNDTPPPTVSGNLHIGHVYQFLLQDFAARFHRMRDGSVHFPFGLDNNGIATERLTERELNIDRSEVDAEQFQKHCRTVREKYQGDIQDTVEQLGISVDWEYTYETISDEVTALSQRSFIELYRDNRQYQKQAPTIWCPDCQTAISQAELEEDEQHGAYHDICFPLAGSDDSITISTTRPELLPACVAVFIHPNDPRADELIGKQAEVPLFGHTVTIRGDERVDPETGTGIVMCCTFGDQTDIEWYQSHNLDLRVAIDESGTMTDKTEQYAGVSTTEARQAITDDLEQKGFLESKRSITHTVQVHERCGTVNEFRVTRQWYVRVLDKKEEYLQAGEEIEWHPEKMQTRYRNWIEGLEWDWCISRQRDAGIPVPAWYCEGCGEPAIPETDDLPVDPVAEDPPIDSCPECGHSSITPDGDVLDTWATSSLTPLINAGWNGGDDFKYPNQYPMTLRPQGHDIISFWLFNTIVKCLEHTSEVPFETVMINGHVLDENREKMSSSKGNIVTPATALENHPTDAIRYWAAGASVGDDFPYKQQNIVEGEKLMRKLWNASKLVEDIAPNPIPDEPAEFNPIDEWLLAALDSVVKDVTNHYEEYEFAKARKRLRTFFWHTFCDDYLELAKQRKDEDSTTYTIRAVHETLVRLFAPLLSHMAEELWNDMYVNENTSIHTAPWPTPQGYEVSQPEAANRALTAVDAIRKWKSDNGLALNTQIDYAMVYADVGSYKRVIEDIMHVDTVETEAAENRPETAISAVILDDKRVGQTYREDSKNIRAAIQDGSYTLNGDGTLSVLDGAFKLEEDMFTVERELVYDGDGEVVSVDNIAVVVQPNQKP